MVNHRVELCAPNLFGGATALGAVSGAPVLLERSERQFMARVQAELAEPARHSKLRGTVIAERKGGGYHLYQPIHRMFHVAVVAAVCGDAPGRPRLDPLRIESAGLVVRKVRDGNGRALGELAWVTDGEGLASWQTPEVWDARAQAALAGEPLAGTTVHHADPDPARRPQRSTGRPELDARIAMLVGSGSQRSESVTPIFPLPPSACASAGETMLVGLVPTASRESEQSPSFELPDSEELAEGGFFPERLAASASGSAVPLAGTLVSAAVLNAGDPPRRRDPAVADYLSFVREMVIAFDISGSQAPAQALRALLRRVQLPFRDQPGDSIRYVDLYAHLVDAARIVVQGEQTGSFRMPIVWGEISAALAAELRGAILAVARARFSGLQLERGRFDERGAQYIVRTFVRVRRDDGCPPVLHWSQPSSPFQIAPWYDGSPGPKPTIDLPNPLGDLSSIQPNVAFSVPSSLAGLLGRNDPEDLLAGKGKPSDESGLAWLCSFSIPIITICAFILLVIFISLLNFVFWWLPFVKICIPIPKLK